MPLPALPVRSCFAAAMLPLLVAPIAAQTMLGLTADNRLLPLRAGSPVQSGPATPITGLAPGENLLALDFRPANGRLYALSDQSRLYTIDPWNGTAIAVGAPFTPALAGSEFGFDFNPTVDRIRVVSDSGQNLRLHPDTGAVVATDLPIAYAAQDPGAGQTAAVAASGYTNSVAGAVTTTLYCIDAARDVLVTQIPPNNGVLNTVGPLGRDVTTLAGFDIVPGGAAWAAFHSGAGPTQLFTVDLATGATTWQGTLAAAVGASRLRGLAVVPPQPDAEAVVLTTDGRLARFELATPWLAPGIAGITGLQPNEQVLAIDFRPATGQLYGLGSSSRLYTIDVATGAATAVGSGFATSLAGSSFGFDFNPTVDRIRIVSDADQNLRAHPDTGAVAAVDLALVYGTTDPGNGVDPAVTAAAYTNSLGGATSTLLYAIDTTRDVLVTQNPPNNGVLNTVGSLGRDIGSTSGFDIGSDGRAFAVLQDTLGTFLVRIDLATGQATNVADLGLALGSGVRGLALRTNGLAAFGAATPGCAGPLWLGAAGTPFAGSTNFALVAHRGPAGALGFFVLAADRLPAPMNFGGLQCWLDPMQFITMPMRTNDAAGTAVQPFALQGAWFGLDLWFQWVGADACGPMGLATSAGLRVTVQ
ncbi:MAG: DUF4394 domain-containing protein [Planctomycetes bacterium]|nr:DUF4394 domain-containing protein [Planctomycetota bacterium]